MKDAARKNQESGETASFGVAQARPNETADPLVFRADAALYEAKRSGKNRVCASESEEETAK